MPPKPPNKTKTRPGLGSVDALPKMGSAEISRLVKEGAEQRTRSRVRDTMRREDPDDEVPAPPNSQEKASQEKVFQDKGLQEEPATNTRPKGTPRPPVTVNQV